MFVCTRLLDYSLLVFMPLLDNYTSCLVGINWSGMLSNKKTFCVLHDLTCAVFSVAYSVSMSSLRAVNY